jgi:hypothetical protein
VVDVTTVSEPDREQVAIRQLRERLVAGRRHTDGEIDAAVARAVAHFARAPIRDYVPLLVERLVRDDLWRSVNGAEP